MKWQAQNILWVCIIVVLSVAAQWAAVRLGWYRLGEPKAEVPVVAPVVAPAPAPVAPAAVDAPAK